MASSALPRRQVFDILEIPQRNRGAGACRRLAKLMTETPSPTNHGTGGGDLVGQLDRAFTVVTRTEATARHLADNDHDYVKAAVTLMGRDITQAERPAPLSLPSIRLKGGQLLR